MRPEDARPVQDRFWPKVDKHGPDDCWLWTASTDQDGYGLITVRVRVGRHVKKRAHRLAWEWANGRKPGHNKVCHTCDNPRCVNPAHLWLGTNKQNMEDAKRKGRTLQGERFI